MWLVELLRFEVGHYLPVNLQQRLFLTVPYCKAERDKTNEEKKNFYYQSVWLNIRSAYERKDDRWIMYYLLDHFDAAMLYLAVRHQHLWSINECLKFDITMAREWYNNPEMWKDEMFGTVAEYAIIVGDNKTFDKYLKHKRQYSLFELMIQLKRLIIMKRFDFITDTLANICRQHRKYIIRIYNSGNSKITLADLALSTGCSKIINLFDTKKRYDIPIIFSDIELFEKQVINTKHLNLYHYRLAVKYSDFIFFIYLISLWKLSGNEKSLFDYAKKLGETEKMEYLRVTWSDTVFYE